MKREYRNFTREEKIKAVKMVMLENKSQAEVERKILGKKKSTGTINRWIREYIQEGEDKFTYQNTVKNNEIDDIYKVISTDTTEVKLEKDGKQNVSFFIDAFSSEILASFIGKSLNSEFIEYNLDLLSKSNYNLDNVVIYSDRGSMYKSGIYKTKTA